MYSKIVELDDSNEVVITGISGIFPNSDNVEEFKENLLAGNDMISTSNRRGTEEITAGFVKSVDRFDNSFFRISCSQAQNMTYTSKMFLEKTFEAILDAGYNPQEIKGKNIAVIGGVWELSDKGDPALDRKPNAYSELFGRMAFMLTNRVSNWLDIHGPGYSMDTACSSSLFAIDHAIKTIQRGQCEGAFVCTTNFILTKLDEHRLTPFLSPEGKSSPFDADASGYVRAEAAVVFFLQRKKFARRIYANVVHSTTNSDGFKEEGFAFPSVEQQIKLYEQFYKEINMDPQKISYIEAHGTGTKVGDIVEGTSIDQFFCTGRKTPLKVGALKSNMGHGESAGALCGLVKLIISFETGIIPANLRFNNPNPNIKGLFNGHIEIISKPTPLEGEFFALNAFGIGGSNGHIVITPNKKLKIRDNLQDDRIVPWLVTASGRTEEAVDCILNDVAKNYNDAEYIRLLHEIFKYDISGHTNRGYIIVRKNKQHKTSKKYFSGEKRPIWFIFAGMGSQWPAMGKSLMEIPIFAESILKSHEVLKSKGLDLIKIITDDDPKMFDNILNSFVGIAAIQIALVDVLNKLKIKPDGIVGHSVGELGCAYADGCFTAEQMLLAAYYRGLVSLETPFVHGTMAAVGENYGVVKDLVPPEIDIACHNGPTSCTVSGPTEIMQNFIEKLNEKKIFVRAVNTSNIAYHSRYIASAGPKFISYLKQIIPEPKLRSEKWICTSAPQHNWDTDQIKYCSAEYHTNNLLNPVYFEESYHFIPENAITIEIAPHSLLNAILKRSLPTTVDNIPLTMRNQENSVEYLLNALGQMYEAGCEMELSQLYPPIEFPVSRSTPMISPLIKWKHEQQFQLDDVYVDTSYLQSSERTFVVDPRSDEYNYIYNHVVDGRNLYPGFGYLWLVVETMAAFEKKFSTSVSVVFENVHFERATTIPKKGALNFRVSVHQLDHNFEIKCNGSAVAKGKVRVMENPQKDMIDVIPFKDEVSNSNILPLNNKDFYKELRLRGYHYKGLFAKVEKVNCNGTYGEISWSDNFVSFMDAMAQIAALQVDCRDPVVPTFIGKVAIDFEKHFNILESLDKENPKFPVNLYPHLGILSAGGIQMTGWKGHEINRQKNRTDPLTEKYLFLSYVSEEKMDMNTVIRICVQIAMQNTQVMKAKSYELLDQDYDPELVLLSNAVVDALSDLPSIEANVNILTKSEKLEETDTPNGITISNEKLPKDKQAFLIILSNIQSKIDLMESILDALRDDGFIITKESLVNENTSFENLGFNVCFSRIINDTEKIFLLNRITESGSTQTIKIQNSTYSWIPELQKALTKLEPENAEKLVVYAENEPTNGILGLFTCLRREEKGSNIRCCFVEDDNAPSFTLENPFYKSQLDKNLCQNIYKNGKWGSYAYLKIDLGIDVETTEAFCTQEERGNLSSFRWVEDSRDPSTYSSPTLVHIYYSSLNFRDVMLAVGGISLMDSSAYSRMLNCYQGGEFSGRAANGVRVMGMLRRKGISTKVESIPHLTWKVPNTITLEEAASLPTVYATVIFAFFFKMKLEEGQSILIHAGSGGVGQAAINVCLHYKCNIFTTVGTPEKKEFIRKTFPQIPENHIGNSRDTSFEKMVMEQTNGRGVDIVLNSLSEDKLRASIRCVAKSGHFLEIGKHDIAKNKSLELGHFLKDIVFYSIQIDVIILDDDYKTIRKIHKKFQEMLDEGLIKPIRRTVFQINEVESAFRFMASGKHMGKLLIKIRDEEKDLKCKPSSITLKAKPRVHCQAHKSYVILGGLGGFGLELVDWLILRGARNVVLSSRTGIKNGYQSYRIELWKSYGANVVISTADISKESGVKDLLQLANSLGPVAGIFNLAVILNDRKFLEQTEDSFKIVTDPKAIATIHLDKLSRKMCPYLEHFVVFSSVMCGLGNTEQTSYGFANSIAEKICETRHSDNLPALAIQWGAMGEVGIVSDLVDNNSSVIFGGLVQQEVKSCLESLNGFMKQRNPVVSCKIVAEKRKAQSDIITTVANALGIKDVKTISLTWTLPELGMDSIIGIELKQILEAEFNIFLTPEDLRTMTFAKLYRLKEEKEKTASNPVEKSTVQHNFLLNEEMWNQPVLRIPFVDGKIQEQLPIDKNPTVFVFPGVEGFASTVESLGKNLPLQVLCFQYHFIPAENFVQTLCNHFSSFILENLPPEQEFYLVGHSLGSAITLEVAEILEKRGRKGHIWLIDSSPTTVKMVAVEKFENHPVLNDKDIQTQICIRTLETYLPDVPKEEYAKYLENAADWESKKKICLSLLSRVVKNEKLAQRLFDRLYNIPKAFLDYKISSFSSNSSCVLIRCVDTLYDLPVDESYNLTEHFKNPVEVHKIDDVDHYSILSHARTAEIISRRVCSSQPEKN